MTSIENSGKEVEKGARVLETIICSPTVLWVVFVSCVAIIPLNIQPELLKCVNFYLLGVSLDSWRLRWVLVNIFLLRPIPDPRFRLVGRVLVVSMAIHCCLVLVIWCALPLHAVLNSIAWSMLVTMPKGRILDSPWTKALANSYSPLWSFAPIAGLAVAIGIFTFMFVRRKKSTPSALTENP